jgi:hypothetical protein
LCGDLAGGHQEGEQILQRADNVVHYLPPKGKTVGRLYLTNYQIIFLSYDKSSYVRILLSLSLSTCKRA